MCDLHVKHKSVLSVNEYNCLCQANKQAENNANYAFNESHSKDNRDILHIFPHCTWESQSKELHNVVLRVMSSASWNFCFFFSFKINERKKKTYAKMHQHKSEVICILAKASHPLSSELTQPHSKFSLRLIPSRCNEKRFKQLFVSTAIQMYSASCHSDCSLSQPTNRALHPGQLLLSLSIALDCFSLLLLSALPCLVHIHRTCLVSDLQGLLHISLHIRMSKNIPFFHEVTMCTSCFYSWYLTARSIHNNRWIWTYTAQC